MKWKLAFVATVAITSCTTSLAPQAESIKTTRTPSDVADCKILGTVEAQPPYIWPGDAEKQLKNKAAALPGTDTVFVTNSVGHIVGVAYRCAR
jgi:hypothetical protein